MLPGPVRGRPESSRYVVRADSSGTTTETITKANAGSGFTFARNDQEAEDIWYSRKVDLLAIQPLTRLRSP